MKYKAESDSMKHEIHNGTSLKAAILAAGKEATTRDGEPLVLKKLGDHTVLQYVLQNALQLVPPSQSSPATHREGFGWWSCVPSPSRPRRRDPA